ncbi:prolipoprotein diacylglyceryl transferase [Galbitalea soli]|uniref:Phosphatidylglycerol--prolipoprotein diacylglyceryl transferase n=1 Tax=Galbitalea soli TaxID=1268042 RepID=A0A7C9PLP8_9MICO|nr:prolipoprotein diacylglyceryl transferase [Galbitalea soli]
MVVPLGKWFQWAGAAPSLVLNLRSDVLCILVAILVAVLVTNGRLTRRGAEPWLTMDFLLGTGVAGLIGARVWHVATHPDDYFAAGKNLASVLYIWEGGLSIFGALLGGAIGALIVSRLSGLRFWSFADAVVPGLLIGQVIGRLGDWFRQDYFGLPTELPWGLAINRPNDAVPIGLADSTLFQPVFLYEMIWNLIAVVVLLLIERQFRLRWGRLFALYLVAYGAGRIWFESIRIDPTMTVLGLRVNVWAAIALVVVGILLSLAQPRRHPGLEPSVYRPGREWSSNPSALDSDETYSESEDGGDGAAHSPETAATSG